MPVRERDSSTPGLRLPRLQQRRPQVQSRTDLYRGYVPIDGSEAARENIDDLDREKLWRKYISCRKPVVIDGLIQERNWQGHKWTDLSYLRQIAGDALVKIEPVDATRDQFGTAAKRKAVTFSTFLDMLEDPKSAGKWYMTTQYDEEDDNASDSFSEEDVMTVQGKNLNSTASAHQIQIDQSLLPPMDFEVSLPAPTDTLAHLFPLPGPSIMGDLVLQQCNLWLGNGKSGKSSGLHHDFHDNLYMLLSGRKRFLIWPPLAHRWLEPVGKVDTVHPNGLIEYAAPGQASLQADGLTRLEAMRWLFRARLRALLEADEKAARDSGEDQVTRQMRKGKGKQTEEQERLTLKLREAEVELLLLEAEEGNDSSAGGSDILSALGTVSNLSDVDLAIDEDLYEEDLAASSNGDSDPEEVSTESDAKSIPPKKGNGKVNGVKKRDQTVESESEEDIGQVAQRTKKKRRMSDKLIIPRGGLPGGLRGSLEDLEGDFDSGDDEFADEDYEGDAIYLERDNIDEDEDSPEAALMTESLRSAVAARMRAMAEGRLIVETGDESSEDGDDDDDSESRSEIGNGMIRQVTTLGGNGNGIEEEDESSIEDDSDASDEDGASWPSLDEDALEEGEAALEKLAQLQALQEGSFNGRLKLHPEDDDPKSFSKISPKVMQWYFNKTFDPATNQEPRLIANEQDNNKVQLLPRFGCPQPIEIHLEAGQMLYLPASWYHEVTSYSDPKEQNGVHMALNYWFHPPTAIGKSGQIPIQTREGSTATNLHNDSTKPYLNVEAWNEIRRCVSKRIDLIRYKAAQAAANKNCTKASPSGTNTGFTTA